MQTNVRTSWKLILVPNVLCVIGAFTLGFGIGASVLTNNVAALAALANGVRPMRKVAALEAERRYLLELQLKVGEGAPKSPGSAARERDFQTERPEVARLGGAAGLVARSSR